jgi:hypothetical protein
MIHPHTCSESVCGTMTMFYPYFGVPDSSGFSRSSYRYRAGSNKMQWLMYQSSVTGVGFF